MRIQWRRWNWGLQQSPSRKSRLSLDHKTTTHSLHLTRLADACQVTIGCWCCRASNTTTQAQTVCFSLRYCFYLVFFVFFSILSLPFQQLSVLAGQKKSPQRNIRTEGRQERVSYFSCVIRHCGQWEQCVFSVVECGQSIWLPGERRPAALSLLIPVHFTVHESDIVVCVCVFIRFKSCVAFFFYLAAKALPRQDWSCCTTLIPSIMTSLHVSSCFTAHRRRSSYSTDVWIKKKWMNSVSRTPIKT